MGAARGVGAARPLTFGQDTVGVDLVDKPRIERFARGACCLAAVVLRKLGVGAKTGAQDAEGGIIGALHVPHVESGGAAENTPEKALFSPAFSRRF